MKGHCYALWTIVMSCLQLIGNSDCMCCITILMQGKRNPRANDPVDTVKNSHFLVLLSENFLEARAALGRSGVPTLPSNQSPVKVDLAPVTSISGPPPTSMPSGCLFIQSSLFHYFENSILLCQQKPFLSS